MGAELFKNKLEALKSKKEKLEKLLTEHEEAIDSLLITLEGTELDIETLINRTYNKKVQKKIDALNQEHDEKYQALESLEANIGITQLQITAINAEIILEISLSEILNQLPTITMQQQGENYVGADVYGNGDGDIEVEDGANPGAELEDNITALQADATPNIEDNIDREENSTAIQGNYYYLLIAGDGGGGLVGASGSQ